MTEVTRLLARYIVDSRYADIPGPARGRAIVRAAQVAVMTKTP